MLPFSVFIIKADGCELCADTLYADGFSVCRGFESRLRLFEFWFYDRAVRKYDYLRVDEFTLSCPEIGKTRFSTRDERFLARFRSLLKEYLSYINTKLETDESELLKTLTGRGFEGGYSADAAQWREKQLSGDVRNACPLPRTELAVMLDTPDFWNAFGSPGFESLYWERNALTGHPITRLPITHAYIGSMFCPRLFPDDAALDRLLNACKSAGITPVVCFPPMPEREKAEYLRRVSLLPEGTELVINDIGQALMLKGRGFRITGGPLITKRPKDPRARLRPGNETDAAMNYETSTDADFYFEYLKRLGIERLSYETCGYPVRIREGSCLHLPKYITNLSMMCPMRAALENGSRALQSADAYCPGYCRGSAFLYPDDMGLIGEGNGLFGISANEINDLELLKRLINGGVSRLIVRS